MLLLWCQFLLAIRVTKSMSTLQKKGPIYKIEKALSLSGSIGLFFSGFFSHAYPCRWNFLKKKSAVKSRKIWHDKRQFRKDTNSMWFPHLNTFITFLSYIWLRHNFFLQNDMSDMPKYKLEKTISKWFQQLHFFSLFLSNILLRPKKHTFSKITTFSLSVSGFELHYNLSLPMFHFQ